MMIKEQRVWWAIGFCVFCLTAAGCPSAGMNGDSNTNDNGTKDNDNSNDNGGGTSIEAGVELTLPNEGAEHIDVGQQATYQNHPPASGPHWSQAGMAPVAAGVYDSAVEEEQWVHNLEHGYVVFLYDCEGPCSPDFLADLLDLFDSAPPSPMFGNTKLVIAPYNGLPFLVAAVAWDRQLHLESLDAAALLDFYERYVDQGPEQVP